MYPRTSSKESGISSHDRIHDANNSIAIFPVGSFFTLEESRTVHTRVHIYTKVFHHLLKASLYSADHGTASTLFEFALTSRTMHTCLRHGQLDFLLVVYQSCGWFVKEPFRFIPELTASTTPPACRGSMADGPYGHAKREPWELPGPHLGEYLAPGVSNSAPDTSTTHPGPKICRKQAGLLRCVSLLDF